MRITENGSKALDALKSKYSISDADMRDAVRSLTGSPDKTHDGESRCGDPMFIRYIVAVVDKESALPANRGHMIDQICQIGGYSDESTGREEGHWLPDGARTDRFLKENEGTLGRLSDEALDSWMAVRGDAAARDMARKILSNGFRVSTTYRATADGIVKYNDAVTSGQIIRDSLIRSMLRSCEPRFVTIDDVLREDMKAVIGNGHWKTAVFTIPLRKQIDIDSVWPFAGSGCGYSEMKVIGDSGSLIGTAIPSFGNMTRKAIEKRLTPSNNDHDRLSDDFIFGPMAYPIESRWSTYVSKRDNLALGRLKGELPLAYWKLADADIRDCRKTLIGDSDYAELEDFYKRKYSEAKDRVVLAVFERKSYD